MQKKKSTINRRMFLKGMGVAMPIPFLASLLPREAWGQVPPTIKRYFTFVGDLDYGHHQNWFPTLNELSQVYDPGNGDHVIRYQKLSELAGPSGLSTIFGSSFAPFYNKMNILRGLNLHTRVAHGQGHMLGNLSATDGHCPLSKASTPIETIDQVLAKNALFSPHVQQPCTIARGRSYSFRRDAGGTVNADTGFGGIKPNQLFQRLFYVGGLPIPEGDTPTATPHPRTDILSRVFDDFKRVRNGRQISQGDKQILDNAADRISDIQRKIANTEVLTGCHFSQIDTSVTSSDGIPNSWYYNPEEHPHVYRLYAEIFAAAAACDLHRVFNMFMSISSFFDRNASEDFHQGHSHKPWDILPENNNKINHLWMGEIWKSYFDAFLVPLLANLDSIIEANGKSILDNSLVHTTLECSTVHSDYSKACLLVGGAAGSLTTGHMIDYSRRSLGPKNRQGDTFSNDPMDPKFGHVYHGAHYNRSLTTVLRALGLNPSDYENPDINTFFRSRSDGLLGTHNNGIANIGGYGHIGPANASGGWSTDQDLYSQEYALYNYHFYKNSLPFPPQGA